ncbi:MAG TPA: aspartate-semialdehyde dehydrogenase [Candidatus Obscuribacterales bacterium]
MKKYVVGILGATGLVGREIVSMRLARNFPVERLVPLASSRSAGTVQTFGDQSITVQKAEPQSFKGIDILFASAGGNISRELAPEAVRAGCVVIDNTSAFRMEPHVPLVVPEVNAHALKQHQGLIANPNCSTAQLVVALKPLHDAFTIKRVVVSTYQAVSGAGNQAVEELYMQSEQVLGGQQPQPQVLPLRIAFNVIPYIGSFLENGYTDEEMKMTNEVRKIMEADIATCATCIRVPVANGHSESVNIEFAQPVSPERAREVLANAPGIVVRDDPKLRHFPYPQDISGSDPVYVGRIRRDVSHPNAINLWVVADNLRKGAALNAIQIAESLIEQGLI